MSIICKKCGYERLPTDTAPDYECPSCGAIYAKIEAHLKKKADVEMAKKLEEERALYEENRRLKELSLTTKIKNEPVKPLRNCYYPSICR